MKGLNVLVISFVLVVGCTSSNSPDLVDSNTEIASNELFINEADDVIPSEVVEVSEITTTSAQDIDSNDQTGISTPSFVPQPFEGLFIQDTTALIELFIYEKRNEEPNLLIDHVQTQIDLITEENQQFIEGVDTLVFLGLVSNQGDPLNELRECEVEREPQESVYVARSTNSSGEFVTLVNLDICGSTPGLQFEDIDGATDYRDLQFIEIVLRCSNASNCPQF